MKKWMLALICTVSTLLSFSQLTGKVIDATTQESIAGASVFFNNTSIGAVTDKDGNFSLPGMPSNNSLLIISSIGYTLQVVDVKKISGTEITIALSSKIIELDNVIVEPRQKESWAKWGQYFMELFIGRSEFAEHCKILNKNKIEFYFYKNSNRLEVSCEEPLIIENKDLGYKIKYTLENFESHFKEKRYNYSGYVFFEEVKNRKKKHLENRKKAYYGSKMHFIRSVYNNIVLEEGFLMQKVVRENNVEKLRIAPIYRSAVFNNEKENLPKDTLDYYVKKMREDDYRDHYLHALTRDSIVLTIGGLPHLYFDDYISISYKNAAESSAYLAYHRENRSAGWQRSLIFMIDKKPMLIYADGNDDVPGNILSTSYWSWRENLSNLLPLDYDPKK